MILVLKVFTFNSYRGGKVFINAVLNNIMFPLSVGNITGLLCVEKWQCREKCRQVFDKIISNILTPPLKTLYVPHRQQVDVIHADFLKAFNKAKHSTLLKNQNNFEFINLLVKQCRSYIVNR